MFVHSARTTARSLIPAIQADTEPRVAVVLNANARHVTASVIRSLSHVVVEEDLFVSRSPMHVRRIARTVLERRYPIVFCGGGDGSFAALAT